MANGSKNGAPAAGIQITPENEVEVSLEKNDSDGIWIPATVVKCLSENSYLVQYWFKEENSEAELQKSIVSLKHIRPPPSLHKRKRRFAISDKVEAFHDFSWRTGIIIKEFDGKRFVVFFKHTNKEMIFSETKLRPHMEWKEGKWIVASQSKVAENDAFYSRPSEVSKSENAAEITTSTGDADAMKTKPQVKRILSQKLKTPTSTVCQTDSAASEAPSTGSSLKTVGRSLDNKVPKVADNDASHSRPPDKSKVKNVAKITTSTGCKTDAMKTKGLSKQNSSPEPKTPTLSKTSAAASKRPRNLLSLETKIPSLDDKVNGVPAAGIQFSTGNEVEVSLETHDSDTLWFPATVLKCLSENSYLVQYWFQKEGSKGAFQKKSVSLQHIRPPPPLQKSKRRFSLSNKVEAFYKFAWSTGLITKEFDSKRFGVSLKRTNNEVMFSETELRPPMEWVDGRWVDASETRVADNDASHLRHSKKSKIVNATEITILSGCKTYATKRKTPSKQIASDLKTQTTILGLPVPSKSPSNILSLKKDNRSLDNTVFTEAGDDASHSRPSKKLKIENAADITTSTSCKTDARKRKTQTKQSASPEPKTPTSIVCRTDVAASGSPSNILSLKNEIRDDNTSKGNNSNGSGNNITQSTKRRGRPPKTPQLSTGDIILSLVRGKESNAGVRPAKGTNKRESKTERFLTWSHNGTRSSQNKIPWKPQTEGSRTSMSDKTDQMHDPAGLVIKESPKNSQSNELFVPLTKMEIPTKSENSKKAVCDQQKRSSRKVGKTSMDPSAKSHHSTVDGVSKGETEGHVVAIDRSLCIDVDVNQILPFEKTVPLWDCIESMEVFKSIPQKPHFRPLESIDEDCRESIAISFMVTFLKIANKIPELRLDMPRSSMEKSSESLVILETNGFDVKSLRDSLNDLLVKKDKQDLLQKDLEEYERQITERKNKKAKFDEAVDEINKKMAEFVAIREELVSKKEREDASIAVSQSSVDRITDHMKSIKSDFEESAGACW